MLEKFGICQIPIYRGWVCDPDLVKSNLVARTLPPKGLRYVIRTTSIEIVVVVKGCRCALAGLLVVFVVLIRGR